MSNLDSYNELEGLSLQELLDLWELRYGHEGYRRLAFRGRRDGINFRSEDTNDFLGFGDWGHAERAV